MKISFMTFACPQWSLAQIIAAATRLDYDGIEFRCDANHQHGVEVYTTGPERRQIAARLRAAGLEAPCLATSLRCISEQVLDEAVPRLALAADLGCRGVRVFCGPLPEGTSPEQAVPLVAGNLRALADLAAENELEVWLETHDSFSHAALAAAAVRAAERPNVGLNYDNMHPFRAGEPLATTLAALEGLVRHVHFHDARNHPGMVHITPFGQGQMPLDEMFAGLLAAGYDGYLSGEWFNDMYAPSPQESLERYRADVVELGRRHGVEFTQVR